MKVSKNNFLGTYSPPLFWSKDNFLLLNNSFVSYFKSNHHKYYDWWCLRNHNMSLIWNDSHTIPYQTRMQPYEQVLASLPSKKNEPYTKPCHNRYQQLDALHHLAFPCTVFYHRCLTLSSVMNVHVVQFFLVDVTNLKVQPLWSPFSIPAARSSMLNLTLYFVIVANAVL